MASLADSPMDEYEPIEHRPLQPRQVRARSGTFTPLTLGLARVNTSPLIDKRSGIARASHSVLWGKERCLLDRCEIVFCVGSVLTCRECVQKTTGEPGHTRDLPVPVTPS